MNPPELLQALVQAALASSVAILLALALRRPMRKAFGARLAYAAWALVPLAMLATLLPASQPSPMAVAVRQAIPVLVVATPPPAAAATLSPLSWVLLLWGAGGLVSAGHFLHRQCRFVRGLGALSACGEGLYRAQGSAGLPAVVGVLRPRIVLPDDCDRRYSGEQQALLRRHEQAHIDGGDMYANFAVVALRCLFWFNPLVHLAARPFRHDQELACDARVLACAPQARRSYGEAMLLTQLAAQTLPVGCHWGQVHPLKERIEMLTRPLPSLKRSLLGIGLLAILLSGGAYASWVSQPVVQSADTPPPPPPPPAAPMMPPPPHDMAPPPPPRPPMAPRAWPSGSVDMTSRQLNPPEYPADAVKAGATGTTVLLVAIDAAGRVQGLQVERSSGHDNLDRAALEAAVRWTFQPAIEGGKPVASRVRVPIQFALKEPAESSRQ